MLSAQEVVFAQQKGVKLIDVRPEDQYDKGHVPDAVNIPFFRPITGWSAGQIVRRMGFAAFGVLNGTEPNPDFMKDVRPAGCMSGGKGTFARGSIGCVPADDSWVCR